MARAAQEAAGSKALVSRMGGDEFAVALPLADEEEKRKVTACIERIYRTVDSAVRSVQGDRGVSAGWVLSGKDADSFKQLYHLADGALYEAKRNGRGKLCCAEEQLQNLAGGRQRTKQ